MKNEEEILPPLLGIQAGGEIIPVSLRYMGKNTMILAVPSNNTKVPYSMICEAQHSADLDLFRTTLKPLVNGFTASEKRKIKHFYKIKANLKVGKMEFGEGEEEKIQITKKRNPTKEKKIFNNEYPQPDSYLEYPILSFKPIQCDLNKMISVNSQALSKMTFQEKRAKAEELYAKAINIYKPDIYNSEINNGALKMFAHAQRLTMNIYPGHFVRIVLPGRTLKDITKLDPDAFLFNPKQFHRFIKRRKMLAQMRSENIITDRIEGVRFEMRSKQAKLRERNSLGIFK